MEKVVLVALLVNSFGCLIVHSFNLDLKEPIVLTSGHSGEYFGFSVALHSHGSEKWVLVGAPIANQTAPPGSRYRMHERYGTVYKCSPNKGSTCKTVPIDTTDAKHTFHERRYWDTEYKTGQWLGATLHSSGNNGKVLVCAPRYAFRGPTVTAYRYRLLGRCFLLWGSLTGTYQQIDPCYHGDDTFDIMYGPRHDGYCQAGFAASLFKSQTESLVLSAVGIDYGKGTIGVYFQDTKETLFAPRSELKMGYWGDSMGYAVTTGKFMSSSSEQIVSSAPRAGNLKGRVMAFDVVGRDKIKVSFTLPLPKDAQMGSFYGHSICAVDLNNDGMSDLLVGAPRYSYNIDEGRVHVYVNNGLGALNLMDNMLLVGDRQPSAYYGFSIASAGDLNKDRYNDVVIGAPYGGDDNRGVVYIYHGTSKGIDTKYKQKITASMVGDSKLKSFGYSLTGGVDMDDNRYPDIAVGAYTSDRVVLLRTRPIVEVEAKIELSEKEIILENNSTSMCDLADGTALKCLTAKVCFRYSHKLPLNQGIALSYSLTLDQDMQSHYLRRMFFLGRNASEKAFISLSKLSLSKPKEWNCDPEYKVFLREKQHIGDILSPLTFDVKYDLQTSSPCVVCPILDHYDDERRRSVRQTVQFQKQCGKDQECVPDMTVKGSVSFSGGYKDLRIGVSNEMNVSITVGNKANDFAYPGEVIVTYPSLLGYIGTGTEGIQCTRITSGDEDTEKAFCIVGTPFIGKTQKSFSLKFTTSEIKGNIRQMEIELFATSPSQDADPSDNKVKLLVNVKFEADLSITGSSVPDEVVYDESTAVTLKDTKKEKDIGPVVRQNMIVKNDGPSAVDGSVVQISIPWKLQKDNQHSYLLYLLDVRVLGSSGSCNAVTNPLNIKIANSTSHRPGHIDSGKPLRSDQKQKGNSSLDDTCGYAECRIFKCRLGRLEKDDYVEIIMTSRVWQNTLVKADAGSIDLITTATVNPPSSITEPFKGKGNQVELLVRANPKKSKTTSETTPTWVIIVSVLGGILLLALVIFILYKCGFFKRNRAKDLANEEEIMTTNGSYDTASQDDSPRVGRI